VAELQVAGSREQWCRQQERKTAGSRRAETQNLPGSTVVCSGTRVHCSAGNETPGTGSVQCTTQQWAQCRNCRCAVQCSAVHGVGKCRQGSPNLAGSKPVQCRLSPGRK